MINREEGAKEEGERIAGFREDKSVVEGSQADRHLLRHRQWWPHLIIL